MELLSVELIDTIATYLGTQDKGRLGRLNRRYYQVTRRRLFQTVTITSPRQYQNFIQYLPIFEEKQYVGYVRKLDLSSYSVRGSGWTEQQAKQIVVATELAHLITVCHYLQQLVIGDELMHVFVEPGVMRAIFTTDHPFLQVIDFTGFCDQKITQVMADLFQQQEKEKEKKEKGQELTLMIKKDDDEEEEDMKVHQWKMPPKLTQLSFHHCMALSPKLFFQPFFERLAMNGNTITRLDLAYTPITNQIFTYINSSTLTHLNLQGCRGIYCCYQDNNDMMAFLSECIHLVELNLNLQFNGIPMGNQFCHGCLKRFLMQDVKKMKNLRVLDLGGQANLTDDILLNMYDGLTRQLQYFSVGYNRCISMEMILILLTRMKQLEYLNVTRCNNISITKLLLYLNHHHHNIQVIEIDNHHHHKNINDWYFIQHGRRGYYARKGIDPRFKYSQKLLLLDEQPQSPMMKYWSFSY
ncbi:uncharacterized protein BX664DRAFT_331987 [Halteromyces radiatus]|uniref:uncharacterized protein n=1 Tax=Halteromyces radiatus TaxID=101107 RepID=UPI00221F8A1E|nr:uncharacterized protein BX664DRAFT_331987 [Halteromyces radiatus]KAI8089022.1 hypothetical protein BX664DRAFT_331987 [Halteromyces radiatus]